MVGTAQAPLPTLPSFVIPGCAEGGSLAIVPFLLLAFVQALHNRRSPWYQRGFVREPLGKIGVILLHDVEHRFLGEPAMVFGKESVDVFELFVGHGPRASAAMPDYTATR